MHVKKRPDFGPSIAIVTDILANTVGGLPVRGHTITADMYQSPYLCLKTLMKTRTCQKNKKNLSHTHKTEIQYALHRHEFFRNSTIENFLFH